MTPNEKVELLICIAELCNFVLVLCLGDVIIRILEKADRKKKQKKLQRKRAARVRTSDSSRKDVA